MVFISYFQYLLGIFCYLAQFGGSFSHQPYDVVAGIFHHHFLLFLESVNLSVCEIVTY